MASLRTKKHKSKRTSSTATSTTRNKGRQTSMAPSMQRTDFTSTPGGYSGGALQMYSTPPWTRPESPPSRGSDIQFVIAVPQARALAADVSLIRAGWLIMVHTFGGMQLSPLLLDASRDYQWNAPFKTLDVVNLNAIPSARGMLEAMYVEGAYRASSDALLRSLETLF